MDRTYFLTQQVERLDDQAFAAFLAWFGGTGYLLTSQFRWLAVPAAGLSLAIGVLGAALMFWMMTRVLWSPEENLHSADFDMVGVLGRLTQPIREGGVGELVYEQGGTRKSCGARSISGARIEKGAEVVVTGYERGIASVQRWSDLVANK
jgi:membrane protein implicated in regulation of membrane protease activity